MAGDGRYISHRAQEMIEHEEYFHVAGGQAFEDWGNMSKMGWAENSLMLDVIREKMTEPKFNEWNDNYVLNGNSETGDPGLKAELARFLPKYFHSGPINTDHLVILNGISSFLECLSHVVGEDGEYFLTPTPWYYSAIFDMGQPFGVNLYDIPLQYDKQPGEHQNYQLTVAKIDKAYKKALKEGKKVRGIILFNPQNPLGVMYSRQLVTDILAWAAPLKLHVISDEIYGRCPYQGQKFDSSVLAVPRPDPQRVHFVYSFSKDWGMIGIRCGMIHTEHPDVLTAVKKRARKYRIPFIVQDRMRKMIQDHDWIDNVFDKNLKSRLKQNYDYTVSRLKSMNAIVYPGDAGLYVWASFSPRFNPKIDAGEKALFQRFMKHRVMLVPGCAASSHDAGFFRILFSLDSNLLKKGLDRIEEVLDQLPKSFSMDELERAVNQPYQGLNPDPTH